MTLEDARLKQEELQVSITEALRAFEEETGCAVRRVDLTLDECIGYTKSRVLSVSVEVGL